MLMGDGAGSSSIVVLCWHCLVVVCCCRLLAVMCHGSLITLCPGHGVIGCYCCHALLLPHCPASLLHLAVGLSSCCVLVVSLLSLSCGCTVSVAHLGSTLPVSLK